MPKYHTLLFSIRSVKTFCREGLPMALFLPYGVYPALGFFPLGVKKDDYCRQEEDEPGHQIRRVIPFPIGSTTA
jgi:hypothetical protein